MFRFAEPDYLYLLILVPIFIGIYVLLAFLEKRRRQRLIDAELALRMMPAYSKRRKTLKFSLLMIALAGVVAMLARPQYGTTKTTEEKKGIEVAISIDVSNSMLADDIKPNRLDHSKLLVSTLIDKMTNDKVALSIFAGEAYPQIPITSDFASAKLFLDNISVGVVTLQGTSIASAINLGRISFTEDKDVGKAIVIITDGEDHEEGAIKAAEEAAKEGIKVYVLGVGTASGSKIPLPEGGYLTDNTGADVVTKLNEEMCREVAKAGNGMYLHVDNSNQAQKVLQEQLSKLKQSTSNVSFDEQDEQFQAIGIIVLLLLCIEFFLMEAKNPLLSRMTGKLKMWSK